MWYSAKHPRYGFTLIELLITIGIIAILSAAVVVVMNPTNLITQSRDAQRVSDLVSINDALKFYQLDGGTSFGTSTRVYISLPDINGDGLCNEYSLPTSTRTYACAASSTYTAVNGNGWIPVNFSSVGTLNFSSLPVDPVGTASGNFYYSYLPGGSWKLTATMESSSSKFTTLAANDGGTDSAAFEVGTDLSLTHTTSTAAASAPSQITDLAATAGDTQVSLSWTAPANGGSAILYYNIYRGISSGGESFTASTTSASYTDTGRSNNTTYYYKVAAVNAVGTATLSSEVSATPLASGTLVWATSTNPSSSSDYIKGLAIDSTYLYIVGDDYSGTNNKWRLEKRNLSDGSLVWATTSNPTAFANTVFAVAVDSSYVYAAGDQAAVYRVEKRNISTGALVWATSSAGSSDSAYGVAVDSNYVYTSGHDSVPGNEEWRIEKRSITNGSLVWGTSSNPSANNSEYAPALTLDSTYVYVIGSDLSPGNAQWRLEKRNISDGGLVYATTTNPSSSSDFPNAITSDSAYLYTAGYDYSLSAVHGWRIEKRNKSDGAIVWATSTNPGGSAQAKGIAVDSSYVYIVGNDVAGIQNEWRFEKRDIANGNLVWATTTDPSSGDDQGLAVRVNSSGVYSAGIDSVPGNIEYRMEKRTK